MAVFFRAADNTTVVFRKIGQTVIFGYLAGDPAGGR